MASNHSSNEVHIFNPEGHPPEARTYSHISVVPISPTTKLVSFAGQTWKSTVTDPVKAPSFAGQVKAALANVDKCLDAAGVSKKHIVSNRQYVVKLGALSNEDWQVRGDIFYEWWTSTEGDRLSPPDALVGVDSLATPDILFEIEITCVAPL